MAKMAFLGVNNFLLCVFKKNEQNNNCVFIVFKADSEPKNEGKNLFGCFSSKSKKALFGGKNETVLKLKFQICISLFVFYCKRKLHTNFHKKIFIFKPPGIF